VFFGVQHWCRVSPLYFVTRNIGVACWKSNLRNILGHRNSPILRHIVSCIRVWERTMLFYCLLAYVLSALYAACIGYCMRLIILCFIMQNGQAMLLYNCIEHVVLVYCNFYLFLVLMLCF
jgi:hypothetical protein